jgi:hypothetical protein
VEQPEPDDQEETTSLDRLHDFVRQLVHVPKEAVDKAREERKQA